jgi:predicted NACHT family NTPase
MSTGNEINLNDIAVKLVEQNAKTFFTKGQQLLNNAKNAFRVKLKNTYADYLQCIYDRHSRAKSFFIREEPVPLYDFYVPMGLSCNSREMSKASIKKITSISKLSIITGKGGSGKSTMMRHLLIDAVSSGDKIPVFIELRSLNQSDQSLLDLIKETLISNKFSFDDNYLDKAFKAGHFIFFFDGFDEINRSKQDATSKQIQKLADRYDRNWMVISSRIDGNLEAWQQFNVFTINHLTLEQACQLIQKVPYDKSIKAKFIEALKESLYEQHHSFLSNPLLLSIMLLTYGENADIPNKLSLFYNQAYETLFQRHDALKGGFKRDRNTKLDIQDFAKVFAAFSILTYDKTLFEFPSTIALEYLSKAKKVCNLEFNEEEYLFDTIQAVNLLVEDGIHIQFTHRSFQEYFAAAFIKEASAEKQAKLIEKYFGQDSIVSLLYEMKPELVEKLYLIPKKVSEKHQTVSFFSIKRIIAA